MKNFPKSGRASFIAQGISVIPPETKQKTVTRNLLFCGRVNGEELTPLLIQRKNLALLSPISSANINPNSLLNFAKEETGSSSPALGCLLAVRLATGKRILPSMSKNTEEFTTFYGTILRMTKEENSGFLFGTMKNVGIQSPSKSFKKGFPKKTFRGYSER
ncbi:hypothetical protein MarSH_167 [Marseillevirus Shanghai 1]|nr:hypothetical protein MarSH_167 [Marseillevirus Shanghai 1]